MFVADPTQGRIIVLDSSGKQRGVYSFAGSAAGALRPEGVAVSADLHVYIADESGTIVRLKLVIPPATLAELQQLP